MKKSFALSATVASLFLTIAPDSARAAAAVNLGFETGDFTGYTQTGFLNLNGGPSSGGPTFETFLGAQSAGTATLNSNAVISAQSGAFDGFGIAGMPIGPTGGTSLAYVTNQVSAGNRMLTGSSLSQSFTVPVGALSLSANLRLLNNDLTSDFAQYNDFAGFALSIGSTVLAQYNLDLDPASAANAHVTPNTNLGGFVNSTPWLTPSFSLAGLAGQTVTFTAYSVNYGGDNSREARLLVDDIKIDLASVPEPGTWLAGLLTLAICGLSRFRPAMCAVKA